VRRKGHALTEQGPEEELRSIARPLRDRGGLTVAATNAGVHAARVPAKTLVQDCLPVRKQSAETIERLLKTR